MPGSVICHPSYYREPQTGRWKTKYLLVLANTSAGDILVAVFTTKPKGLRTEPPCTLGHPREGYYVGIPGAELMQESWIAFDSLDFLDESDAEKKRTLALVISNQLLCQILRCLLQSSDVTFKQAKYLGDTAAELACP